LSADGKQICLDEPCALQPEAKLPVLVVPGDSLAGERQAWLAASQAGLARADGEEEPDYSNERLRETPPCQ
jgi:hypothetical protein